MESSTISRVMSELGKRGKGQAKARDSQAMREAQKKSVEKRKANQAKVIATNEHGHSLGVENK